MSVFTRSTNLIHILFVRVMYDGRTLQFNIHILYYTKKV